MADDPYDPYAFLSGLSAHPDRPGDVSNFNPAFASRLANALQQARAAGLPVSLMSGFREPGQTGSPYDAGGNSSHTYGLASDINGLDGPNGKITQQWAQIAEANGLHNPYGIGDKAEFNHWQLPATPLEQQPQLLASLKAAKATGNFQNVWSAYNAGGGPARPYSATPTALGTTINTASNFYLPPNAPMGMQNNNPLNIKYYPGAPYGGLLGPSTNTDQGDPQMVFATPQAGWNAAYSLLSRKYGSGMTTPDQIIAGKGGWTPGNTTAAANVAKLAGIGPDEDIGFSDPAKAQKFMRALVTQEQGGAAKAYPDAMIAGALAQAQNTPVSPRPSGAMTPGQGGIGSDYAADARNAPTALAGGAGAPGAGSGILPGFGTADASNAFLKGASGLDKALGGKGLPGQSGGGEAGGGQDRPSPMIPAPPAIGVSPLLSQAPMAYGQTLNSLREPMQWGSSPPGSPPFPNAGAAVAPTMPMGTSLAALQQLQMLMAQGDSPYGDYGYG